MGMSDPACWCGNTSLASFNDDYALCEVCQTLVLRHAPAQADPHVRDDQADFYGRSYWFEHMEQEQGYANIVARSRSDLSDRGVHWLRSVLRYKQPPGKSLELGCGNGSFVAMMRWYGFDAGGLELSPWVVEFAKSTFAIPMLLGPLEDQSIEPGSLDVIAMMDVLEHLPDPLGTIRRVAELLRGDGMVVAQTPGYVEGTTYAEMVERHDPFLVQLKPREHVHLFSRRSVAMLMERAGLGQVWFEPAVFGDYDMFPFASRVALPPVEATTAKDKPDRLSPVGRSIDAMLDLYTRFEKARELAENRQVTIETQAKHIAELSADYDRRLEVIQGEQRRVAELSEAVDRLQSAGSVNDDELVLRLQQLLEKTSTIEAMTHHIEQLSADYDRRGEVIAELQRRVEAINSRLTIQSASYQSRLQERDEQIRTLAEEAVHHRQRLAELDSQLADQTRVIAAQHERVVALSADGDRRLAEIGVRDEQIAAQAGVIAAGAEHVRQLSADYDRRLEAIHARDGQIAEQARSIAAQHEHIRQLSADYDRRLEVINEHVATIASQGARIAEQAATIAGLQGRLDAGAAEAASLKSQIAELGALVERQKDGLQKAAAAAESLQGSIDELRRDLSVANDELLSLRSRLGVRMLKRVGLA
jgi:SAM-dependent methyltransferase